MVGYQSAVLAYKIVNSGKPSYIANKLKQRQEGMQLRGRLGSMGQVKKKLSISKEGFIFRGGCILNRLDDNLRNEEKLQKFKVGIRAWVKKNISIKPCSKYPSLAGKKRVLPQAFAQDEPGPNDIRRFLVPISQAPTPPSPADRPPPTARPPTTSHRLPTTSTGIERYFQPIPRPRTVQPITDNAVHVHGNPEANTQDNND